METDGEEREELAALAFSSLLPSSLTHASHGMNTTGSHLEGNLKM